MSGMNVKYQTTLLVFTHVAFEMVFFLSNTQ